MTESKVNCPYCGELISVLLDPEEIGQQYIEDCQVCCRPITLIVSSNMENQLTVSAHDENDPVT